MKEQFAFHQELSVLRACFTYMAVLIKTLVMSYARALNQRRNERDLRHVLRSNSSPRKTGQEVIYGYIPHGSNHSLNNPPIKFGMCPSPLQYR